MERGLSGAPEAPPPTDHGERVPAGGGGRLRRDRPERGAHEDAERVRARRMLVLPEEAVAVMTAHAARAYPEECCGVLLGSDGPPREVARAVPAGNARADERSRRYLIGPESVRAAEAAAAETGLEVIGFYHSHPDHAARPSAFDREHAWPWYTYVIVPATSAGAGAPRAWRLRDDRAGFDEMEVDT